ncbi:MAG: hypothetical protein H6819_02850 [Phycisphaerales bacterium]|nr:hypothetical protein [Phycisphaerales bacterium]MCB9856848.1 hypothetical protein [Phycisphaerales bacterium]MCB9862025.1 hypothetical protein [Phycisphaerales bacterium]
MFACKYVIAAMNGPSHSDAFPVLLIIRVGLLAGAVILLSFLFDRRRKSAIHALLTQSRCLNCEAELAADLSRCPACGLVLDEQDRIRREYEHFCAPGSHTVNRAERRHAVLASIFVLFWLGMFAAIAANATPWIDTLRQYAPNSEVTQVVVTVAGIAFFLVPGFLLYNRSQRRTRRLLLPIKDRCINCGGHINELPDDAFCPHCNASLLKRRFYLREYKLE